jgi:hypothetical protein
MRSGFCALVLGLVLCAPVAALAQKTDADYDKAIGVGKGRSDGTLKTDPSVDGKTFTAPKGFGKENCPVTFKFEKAETGTYPYNGAGGDPVTGVNVKISVGCNYAQCNEDCNSIKLIQFGFQYDIGAGGKKTPSKPDGDVRQTRAGWGTPNAPSRGWQVDQTSDATDPYYVDDSLYGQDGSASTPAVERDSPGGYNGSKNRGKQFLTCAICAGGKPSLIGCLRWGYSVDGAGKVRFEPSPPEPLSPPAPTEAKDATDRWNAMNGNTKIGIKF